MRELLFHLKMDSLLSLVLTLAWVCLEQTPFSMKNVLFAKFFQTFDLLRRLLSVPVFASLQVYWMLFNLPALLFSTSSKICLLLQEIFGECIFSF